MAWGYLALWFYILFPGLHIPVSMLHHWFLQVVSVQTLEAPKAYQLKKAFLQLWSFTVCSSISNWVRKIYLKSDIQTHFLHHTPGKPFGREQFHWPVEKAAAVPTDTDSVCSLWIYVCSISKMRDKKWLIWSDPMFSTCFIYPVVQQQFSDGFRLFNRLIHIYTH